MSDVLGEWLARELRLKIDGKFLVVKPTMEHFRKLKEQQKNPIDPDDKAAGEDFTKKQRELFESILKTTYPDSQFVDDFLDRYDLQFMMALYVALGWASEDTFEALKKKALLDAPTRKE